MCVGDVIVRPVAADAKSFFVISSNKASPYMYELRASSKSKAKAWAEKLEDTVSGRVAEWQSGKVAGMQPAPPLLCLLHAAPDTCACAWR